MCDWPRLSGELLRINLSAANLPQRASKGGLHAGQKEVKPAQGKQTLLRRRSRFPQGPQLSDTHCWGYAESGGGRA